MSEAEDRGKQLETLLNAERSLTAAIQKINAQLRLRPRRDIRLQLLAAKTRLVAQRDEVRRKIHDILSRSGAINPPADATFAELSALADRAEDEANRSATAEATITLAGDIMSTAENLDLSDPEAD